MKMAKLRTVIACALLKLCDVSGVADHERFYLDNAYERMFFCPQS